MRAIHCRHRGVFVNVFSALLSTTLLLDSTATAQLPRLQIHANGHYLQTSTGQPFFWLGDMAWRAYRLSPSEMDQYLSTRKQQGFTVIQGPVIFSSLPNYNGDVNYNVTQPNAAYYANLDLFIDKAAQQGLYVAPVVMWRDSSLQFNHTTIYNLGQYIGNRYRTRTNIAAFIMGGEYNHPSSDTPLWNQLALGLKAGMAGTNVNITSLPRWYGTFGGHSTSGDFHSYSWLSFNALQSSQAGDCTNNSSWLYYAGTHNWTLVASDWSRTPAKPVVDIEATLEQYEPGLAPNCEFNPNRWPAYGVRRRAYWAVFAGAFGHTYGGNGVYQFNKSYDPDMQSNPLHTWDVAINYEGANDMIHLRRLIESRPFFTRIPGQDMLMAPIDNNVPTHVQMTRDSGGKYAMAYIPGANRSITVDMDFVGGTSHKFWWYDCKTGAATVSGTFTRSNYGGNGSFSRTTPSSGEDWVLVIDDAAQNYPAPGSGGIGNPPGDINGDGLVNVTDLLAVIDDWGACSDCPGDVNNDGSVNVGDMLLVIGEWG